MQVFGVILPLENDARVTLKSFSASEQFGGSLAAMAAAVAPLQQRLPGPVAQPPALVMEFVEGCSLR